jgi:hypothetical protein
MDWKSKEELDKEQKFSLLPQDDYELIVIKQEKVIQDDIYAKPEVDGSKPKVEVVNVTLEVVACKDGSEALDEEEKSAKGRKIFFTITPEHMGFKGDVPSGSRSFIAQATGQDPNGTINLNDWNDLIGKTIYAEIVQKKNMKGQLRNKIARIISSPKSKTKKVAEKKLTDDDIEELKKVDTPIIDESAEGVNVKDIPF